MATTREAYETGEKRVYYLSLEFLIGRLLTDALSNLGLTDAVPRGARATSASTSTRSPSSSPTRRSATAASAGSPPASWRAWRRSACRPSATASATTTACSARRSSDGWQHELPEDWLAFGNPWEFERPGGRLPRSASAAGSSQRRRRRAPARLAAGRDACSRSPTTRRWSAGAAATSTRCGSGRRARSTRCGSTPSTAATTSARSPDQARAEASRASSIPTTSRRPARSCACGRSTSSPRPSLQDLVRRHLQQPRRPAQPARQGRRSSSTTPIRRSPSPS